MKTTGGLKAALIALGALSVTACVSLLPETEPVQVYRLSSPEPVSWDGGDWTLISIERPQAPRGLSGDEIALLMEEQHIAYMAGARWIAPAPQIVQDLVIDTFNGADPRLAPARPDDGVRADYELRLDLREFEAAYDQGRDRAPIIRVRLAARLVAEDGRRFMGAQVFSAQVRAGSNRRVAIVAAFDSASRDASSRLAAWVAAQTEE